MPLEADMLRILTDADGFSCPPGHVWLVTAGREAIDVSTAALVHERMPLVSGTLVQGQR